MKLSCRARRSIVATAAIVTFTAGIAGAQAGFLGATSGTVTVTSTINLPVVPTTYHRVAGGAASAYTPSLEGGTVTVSVTTSAANVGAIVTDTDFACPSDSPNPVASISLAGGSGSVTVRARISGTTKLPDGTPASHTEELSPAGVELGNEGMELYALCTA